MCDDVSHDLPSAWRAEFFIHSVNRRDQIAEAIERAPAARSHVFVRPRLATPFANGIADNSHVMSNCVGGAARYCRAQGEVRIHTPNKNLPRYCVLQRGC